MGTARSWLNVLGVSLTLSATPARLLAGPPAVPGVLAPEARPHGYTLTDLATGWLAWAFGTPASVNPLIANRCEQSPVDPKVWFLPVSLGGEALNTCYVPQGTVVVLILLGNECSEAEGFGSTVEELTDCAESVFGGSRVELTVDGRTATDLEDYLVTTRLIQLPPDNLIGPSATPSLAKGYFVALAPLSRGTHVVHAAGEFPEFNFAAGMTYTIVVR